MNNKHIILNDLIKKPNQNMDSVNLFLSDNFENKRYCVGKNNESLQLISNFKIDGIVDDYAENNTSWSGIPLVKMSSINEEDIVVNCSTSISPNTVYAKLIETGCRHVINFYEIELNYFAVTPPLFVKQMRDSFNSEHAIWQKLINSLEDEESKNILGNIINFRLSGDPQFMSDYSVRLNDQYLESFMNYTNETFVDVGGFDGDTTEEFCKRYSDYNKILFFEPSDINMQKAIRRLSGYSKIEYFNYGLSDSKGTVYFNENNGSASAISSEGSVAINTITLDELILENVSVIKMDIEGWELNALRGCKNHIKRSTPKMAIAVYHNSTDFIEIPKLILSYNSNYKIYLRHYTEGWSESVMFFMPR